MDISNVPWNVNPENPFNPVPQSGLDVCDQLKFRILNRVGSASLNGRVYEIEQTTTERARMALKFMLVDNVQECEIASRLGYINPTYFPRVIHWNVCQNVILKKENEEHSDTFIEHAERSYIKHFVSRNFVGTSVELKRLKIKLTGVQTTGTVLMQTLSDMGVPHSILSQINLTSGSEMLVMASELLSTDLSNFIIKMENENNNKKRAMIPRFVSEVFAGLRVLVRERIVHEDLHLGNILLRYDENKHLTAVIHDFGESTEDREPYEHLRDIKFFLYVLMRRDEIGRKYEDLIQSCQLMVFSLNDQSTKDDVISLLIELQKAWSSITPSC